jgi:excisionase family DNA binding protein
MPSMLILAERSGWLTTADVARILGVTTRWVRWLARAGQIRCETTRSGQRIFREAEVKAWVGRRVDGQLRRRAEVLKAIRPQMLRVDLGPRQTRLRLKAVNGDESALPHAEAKDARTSKKTGQST